MYSHCNSKEPSHPHSRNLWPQQMGCRMRCTGDQWRRACTGTGQTLGRRTARRNPPGSSHMGDRCRSPVGGSETPADTCAKAPSTAHFQHWINPCIRRRQAQVLAHIKHLQLHGNTLYVYYILKIMWWCGRKALRFALFFLSTRHSNIWASGQNITIS